METDKIKQFAAIVQEQERKAIITLCGSLNGNETAYLTHIKPKKKYTYVDVGYSGRYIVDGENVYGCKAYGVINRRHFFGTLTEILEHGYCLR